MRQWAAIGKIDNGEAIGAGPFRAHDKGVKATATMAKLGCRDVELVELINIDDLRLVYGDRLTATKGA